MTHYEPTWESVNRHNPGGTAPEWFMDAKFGIYFHWGPYSVPAFGSEWYAKWISISGHDSVKHLSLYTNNGSRWRHRLPI